MIHNPVIPYNQSFYNAKSQELCPFQFDAQQALDHQSICFFLATGFFIDDTTHYRDIKVIKPATDVTLHGNKIIKQEPYWRWHYSPREISLKQAVEEFAHLFDKITQQQLAGKKVILPLSGGLDSRSQAAAIAGMKDVFAYSYDFRNGIPETKYGEAIARAAGFKFNPYKIEPSYLWPKIEALADINQCFSEFTHPRQMAIYDHYDQMGEIFYLGHWGDVLFDNMGVDDHLSNEEVLPLIYKKVLKKGGLEVARSLWQAWGLAGEFEDVLQAKLLDLLNQIKIDNANARLRAFKSIHWAPRWTSINLSVFESKHPMALPYYHEEMCKFICTVPEEHLAKRRIQMEYIKMKAPTLASISWQQYDPYNLYNYEDFNKRKSLPLRAFKKIKRKAKSMIFDTQPVQRNWEIQFLGADNDKKLRQYLFENVAFQNLVPQEVAKEYYTKFREKDGVFYSHPVSMLLTLSLFAKRHLA